MSSACKGSAALVNLQTHCAQDYLKPQTFISSPHHLLLAGSHPLRSHYVGDLIICQHQTYIRAGICCCFFLQIIGAPPPCSHSSLIKSHLVLNMVSSSPSCALISPLICRLPTGMRTTNASQQLLLTCVYPQASTQFIFRAVTARHLTVTRICSVCLHRSGSSSKHKQVTFLPLQPSGFC